MSLGQLLPAPGEGGGNTEAAWRRDQDARGADRRGQDRPDGGGAAGWRRRSNRSSIRTPTGTGRAGRRWTRWRHAGSAAGRATGSSIWTSRSSSTAFRGTSSSRRWRRTPTDPWVVLYVKRWLAAPLQLPDGTLRERDRGTPQGSAVSPVLANLFLHYAFDAWMAREFPGVPFERYADDAVVHCVTERQAERVLAAIGEQDGPRSGCGCTRPRPGSCTARTGDGAARHEHTSFTFLGFTFRARAARGQER